MTTKKIIKIFAFFCLFLLMGGVVSAVNIGYWGGRVYLDETQLTEDYIVSVWVDEGILRTDTLGEGYEDPAEYYLLVVEGSVGEDENINFKLTPVTNEEEIETCGLEADENPREWSLYAHELDLNFEKLSSESDDNNECNCAFMCLSNNCLFNKCKPASWECYDDDHCDGRDECKDHECKRKPSGGGGGGGGGAPPSQPQEPTIVQNTHTISDEQYTKGFTEELKKDDKVKFKHKGSDHELKVLNVGNNSADFEIKSTPQQFTLEVGEDKNLDITEDGYYDVNVKLDAINADKTIEVTIKENLEEVPETEEQTGGEEPEVNVTVEKKPFKVPYQDEIVDVTNKVTGAVAGAVEDQPGISFGVIAAIILGVAALIFAAYYGGFPLPRKSRFDRATYFHRKAEIEYRKGNNNKSKRLHRKAQNLREKGERSKLF